MINIITAGRTDLDGYFKQSGVFSGGKLNHTPLLIFVATPESVKVQIVEKVDDILVYPDETPVMGQWRGEWHSDFFQFTVGQYRQFLQSQPGKFDHLKAATNVEAIYGRELGTYRSMHYEYVDERGSRHIESARREDIPALVEFFKTQGIAIKEQK